MENAKRQIEDQEIQEKMRRAQLIRGSETERLNSISCRMEERRRKVRSKAEREKSELELKIKAQEERLSQENKYVHDKIFD